MSLLELLDLILARILIVTEIQNETDLNQVEVPIGNEILIVRSKNVRSIFFCLFDDSFCFYYLFLFSCVLGLWIHVCNFCFLVMYFFSILSSSI